MNRNRYPKTEIEKTEIEIDISKIPELESKLESIFFQFPSPGSGARRPCVQCVRRTQAPEGERRHEA